MFASNFEFSLYIIAQCQALHRSIFVRSSSFCRTWGEHVLYKNCSECQKQFLYTTCSPQVWAWNFHALNNSMNNLSSYCGLVDEKTRASDKDLSVQISTHMQLPNWWHTSRQCHIFYWVLRKSFYLNLIFKICGSYSTQSFQNQQFQVSIFYPFDYSSIRVFLHCLHI